ncbi:BTAD domain-containing putative transcriptional regulator [Streptomyces sp. NPDC004596]|uniref:BTAD domain-containing putative transcriptional regulator n=1 Tax=Streptomyces sp. DSM 118148 TaxID=3448667 RepID=UPI00403FD68A
MAAWFGVLGVVEVWCDGVPADVGHARQRQVLAALLVDAGQVVPADALVARVWGERAPRGGRDVLYGYVSRLRTALAAVDVPITRTRGGYLLAVEPRTVDLHRFRDLGARAREATATSAESAVALWEEMLGLWRGEPFAGADTPWFNARRTRLEAERLSAQLDLTELRLGLGRHAAVLSECEARARAHPLDERVAGHVMLALYRAGRAADALARYQDIRRRLAHELGVDPGPGLRDLHRRILANDPALSLPEPSPHASPAGGAPPPVPRQLPAPPVHFVGRDEEIAVLDKMLAAQDEPRTALQLSVICGTGGVGKTWLALRWAHSRQHGFPDGQLFADLRGFTPSGKPADPSVVIRGFLDALGVAPERIPATSDAQAALYRSLLADRRVLVVLDNARDTEQLLPLLPGTPTCTVVITSRAQLTGLAASHQATHLTLDGFDSATARELLVGRLGAERVAAEADAAATLVAQCAGLPLALSVLAARITTNPVFTLTALTEELRESDSRLDALDTGENTTTVRTVLASSYRALDPDTARVFRQFAQVPGPDIAQAAASSLTDLPLARARRALHRLRAAHLLQELAPGRFGCHDLLRAYAIEVVGSVDGAEGEAARVRVLEHYLHTAWSADRLLHPHRDPLRLAPAADGVRPEDLAHHDRAMTWFTEERPALVAAVHQAARHGHETYAWQLAWALTTFLTRRGLWHDVAAVHTTALAAAERLGDAAAQAESLRALAWERIEAGDHDAAHRRLAQALSLIQDSGQILSEAETHLALGWLHEHTGDWAAALRHDEHAARLFTRLGHRAGLARALNAVAWDHVQRGDPRAAVSHCEQAMVIHGELDDPRGQANTLDTLGYAYQRLGEFSEALTCHRRSLELHRALGHRPNEALDLIHLGEVHRAMGDLSAARHAVEEAIGIYRDIEVHPARVEHARTLLASLGTSSTASQ